MGRTKKRTKKALWRLWGYILLAFAVYAWTTKDVGAALILITSALSVLYMLFAAPMWCMAPNSTNGLPCSNNAHGLLIGCWITKHKWQKVKMIGQRQRWAALLRRSWSSIGAQAASFGVIASSVSAAAAAVTLMVKK